MTEILFAIPESHNRLPFAIVPHLAVYQNIIEDSKFHFLFADEMSEMCS
jgi:hypothetical protein